MCEALQGAPGVALTLVTAPLAHGTEHVGVLVFPATVLRGTGSPRYRHPAVLATNISASVSTTISSGNVTFRSMQFQQLPFQPTAFSLN